ncbi:MAG: hypothetical protein KKA79_01315 [Nanoarchaeota archaeon]|nr:hypothetical protein [Nanoarchaeota archaeon]
MKTVVFLRREPTSRLYNLAYALKKTNKYRVVLVCDRFDNYNLSKFNQVFDEIICYQILDFRKYSLLPTLRGSYLSDLVKDIISFSINWKIGYLCEHLTLPKILKKINPDACVCQHTEHFLTTQVIKNVKCPVILNVHNGSRAVGIESLSKKEYNLEKYCFEHAGGIIHRGPEFEIDYYREHRYNITCPILRYLDYCNKEFFLDYEAKKLSMQDKEYHLVDIGGGFSAYIFPTSNIKKITNQKMHFHQYFPRYIPHMFVYQSSHKVYRDIVNLYKSEKYFHFERPMPFDKITHEISK